MPRSLASSSSSSGSSGSSDEDLLSTPDSASASLPSDFVLLDPADNDAVEAPTASERSQPSVQGFEDPVFEAKRESFTEELVKHLCLRHLQHQLQQDFSSRQAAAQLREFKRRHETTRARSLQNYVAQHLEPERKQDMEHMVGAVRIMLDEDTPENDLSWMQSLANGPLPNQTILLQTMQRAMYDGLQPTVGNRSANMVAGLAAELASNTLYLRSMRLLWPLVKEDKRLQIQQWIIAYRASAVEADRVEQASSPKRVGMDLWSIALVASLQYIVEPVKQKPEQVAALVAVSPDMHIATAIEQSWKLGYFHVIHDLWFLLPAMALAAQLSEEQQKEMLHAQDQANLMHRFMETPGATPSSLGALTAPSTPMETAANEHKRLSRGEASEPERRQGKGSKLPRNDNRDGGWANPRSRDGWGNDWWKQQGQEEKDSKSAEVVELCYAMAQLTKGMLSMVPDMFKATTVWQKAKAESPQDLTLSLRATLLQRFTSVWLQRLEACVATEEAKAQAVEMMILREDGTVPYLQYNKTAMKLVIKEDREPMDFDEVRRIIKELGDLALLPLTILRFHPLRKLVEEYQGDILPMTLQLGLRTPEADRCWQHCSRLAHSGACRAVAMTMRGEKLGRTGLAVHIQEMMNKRSGPYA
ncbi:unnamed protein product [Symbiodinium microadriaticum]|nr:unnamed protein product [Symbiodinium microadriaticum]